MQIVKSSITSRGTTTIPQEIRFLLGLNTGDEVMYLVENGSVIIKRVSSNDSVCPCCKGTGRCKIKKESDSS